VIKIEDLDEKRAIKIEDLDEKRAIKVEDLDEKRAIKVEDLGEKQTIKSSDQEDDTPPEQDFFGLPAVSPGSEKTHSQYHTTPHGRTTAPSSPSEVKKPQLPSQEPLPNPANPTTLPKPNGLTRFFPFLRHLSPSTICFLLTFLVVATVSLTALFTRLWLLNLVAKKAAVRRMSMAQNVRGKFRRGSIIPLDL
jgi:hypothetical protein